MRVVWPCSLLLACHTSQPVARGVDGQLNTSGVTFFTISPLTDPHDSPSAIPPDSPIPTRPVASRPQRATWDYPESHPARKAWRRDFSCGPARRWRGPGEAHRWCSCGQASSGGAQAIRRATGDGHILAFSGVLPSKRGWSHLLLRRAPVEVLEAARVSLDGRAHGVEGGHRLGSLARAAPGSWAE